MWHKVSAQKLGLGMTTDKGAYYPKVDGKPVGENGRAFWPTREEAKAVARRFAAKLVIHESQQSNS